MSATTPPTLPQVRARGCSPSRWLLLRLTAVRVLLRVRRLRDAVLRLLRLTAVPVRVRRLRDAMLRLTDVRLLLQLTAVRVVLRLLRPGRGGWGIGC